MWTAPFQFLFNLINLCLNCSYAYVFLLQVVFECVHYAEKFGVVTIQKLESQSKSDSEST